MGATWLGIGNHFQTSVDIVLSSGNRSSIEHKMTEEGRAHPHCRNASNPYHECSDYCFKIIAEVKARIDAKEQGMFFPFFVCA